MNVGHFPRAVLEIFAMSSGRGFCCNWLAAGRCAATACAPPAGQVNLAALACSSLVWLANR